MKAIPRRRLSVWLVLLVIAAGLAMFGNKTPSEPPTPAIAQPRARVASADAPAKPRDDGQARPAVTPAVLLTLSPRDALIRVGAAKVDLFSQKNWTPPLPPMAPAPIAAPVAPPLPYTYVGKKQEDGQWEVYLSKGDATYIVRQGSPLEGVYVVERVAPPTMTLKYVPLDQAQTLAIGE